MDRRTFIKGGALGLGLAGMAPVAARAGVLDPLLARAGVTVRDSKTPIKHIVVVMMENRSTDHLLGWYGAENPDFDGRPHQRYRDLRQGPGGPLVATENWGQAGRNSPHGRGFADPSHGWTGGRLERNGGAADGWLHPDTNNDEFALSYYGPLDVPVWAQLTRDYQAYDRWFCSVLGPTFPNRYYLHSATAGGLKNNDVPPELASEHPEWALGWDWPTLWTLFDAYSITASYFFCNLPVPALWGPRHLNTMHHISEYYARCEAGNLPQVSFVDPFFTIGDDFGNDDHPHADLRLGQAFLSDVVEAFATSKHYREGALVITYDEWGGFFDHVDPPRLPDDRGTPGDPGGVEDFGQLGFRIPTTVVSPWTRGNAVDHTVYEASSIGKFICDNWGLPHLTTRMRATNSLGLAFRGFRSFDPDPAFVPYEAPVTATVESLAGAIENTAEDPTQLPFAVDGLGRLRDMGWFDKLGVRTDWKLADAYRRARPELLAAARGTR